MKDYNNSIEIIKEKHVTANKLRYKINVLQERVVLDYNYHNVICYVMALYEKEWEGELIEYENNTREI